MCLLNRLKLLKNSFLGVCRLFVFLVAVETLFHQICIVKSEFTLSNNISFCEILIVSWRLMVNVILFLATILVLGDCVVASEGPLGESIEGESFLSLFKLPPSVFRSLLWILLASTSSCTPRFLINQDTEKYSHKGIQTISFINDLIKSVALFPIAVYLIVTSARCRREIFNRRKINSEWSFPRFYEDTKYIAEKNTVKTKIQYIIYVTITLMAFSVQLVHLLSLQEMNKLHADKGTRFQEFEPLLLNGENKSNVFLFENEFPDTDLINTAERISKFLNTYKPVVANALALMFLFSYFVRLAIKKSCTPVHTMVKVLLLFCGLSSVSSNEMIQAVATEMDTYVDNLKLRLWIMATFPFIFIVPITVYAMTKKVRTLFREFVEFFASIIKGLYLTFRKRKNQQRLLHAVCTILGTLSFVCLLLSLPLPWFGMDILPKGILKRLINIQVNVTRNINNALHVFDNILERQCFVGQYLQNELQKIKNQRADCFLPLGNIDRGCENVAKVYDVTTEYTTFLNECKPVDDCNISTLWNFGESKLVDHYLLGADGPLFLKLIMSIPKVNGLLKLVYKLKNKLRQTRENLFLLQKQFQSPLDVLSYSFVWDLSYLFIFFPVLLTGLIIVSFGFWKRSEPKYLRSSSLLSASNMIVMFLFNLALCIIIWNVSYILPLVTFDIPLLHLLVRNEWSLGFALIQTASTCSAVTCFLFMENETGTIQQLIKFFRSCCLQFTPFKTNKSARDETETSRLESTITDAVHNGITNSSIRNKQFQAFSTIMVFIAVPFVIMGMVSTSPVISAAGNLRGQYSFVSGKILTEMKDVLDLYSEIQSELLPCDKFQHLIISPTSEKFVFVFSQDAVKQSQSYLSTLQEVLHVPKILTFNGLKYFVLTPPLFGIFVFFISMALNTKSCRKLQKALPHLYQLSITCFYIEYVFLAWIMITMRQILMRLPILDVSISVGPAVYQGVIATLLLFISHVQISIECVIPL